MAKPPSDPTKDPEFQRVVQNLLKTPPIPHKPVDKREKDKPKANREDDDVSK